MDNFEQMSIFEFLDKERKPGEWISDKFVGRILSFEEIFNMVGRLIVMDKSTSSRRAYKIVQIERTALCDGVRRFIYYDGAKQRGLVSESMYYGSGIVHPAIAYELID